MVVVNIFDPKVVVGRGPSWSRKGLVMRRYNPNANPTSLQVQAMVNLVQASRQAASQTAGMAQGPNGNGGAARVIKMNQLVSEQLGGRGAGGGAYAQKTPSVGANGPGFLAAQARKYGIAYGGGSIAAPVLGGGSFF